MAASFSEYLAVLVVISLCISCERNIPSREPAPKVDNKLVDVGDPFSDEPHSIDDMFEAIKGEWFCGKNISRMLVRGRKVHFEINQGEKSDFLILNDKEVTLSESLSFDCDGKNFDFYWIWDDKDHISLIVKESMTSIEFQRKSPSPGSVPNNRH